MTCTTTKEKNMNERDWTELVGKEITVDDKPISSTDDESDLDRPTVYRGTVVSATNEPAALRIFLPRTRKEMTVYPNQWVITVIGGGTD
ncbi:hypothetical protein ACFTWH_08320 [Streptomyces sp. NPDC057011]|uniref:hypothetical protein n=1 Tax=unclassified Streptomyces TaxID=2593676 RepID=UPI00362F3888